MEKMRRMNPAQQAVRGGHCRIILCGILVNGVRMDRNPGNFGA